MAGQFNSEVVLLHVIEPGTEKVSEGAMAELETFGTGKWGSARLLRVVESGDAAEKIAQAAEGMRPGLIMLPTHGYGMFRRWLLGSVTAKLLHDIRTPIWTDAHLEEIAMPRNLGLHRILCALNLEQTSVTILRWAEQFARACNAETRLVHAIPAAEHIPGQPDEPFCLFLQDMARTRLEQIQKEAGTHIQSHILGGDISRTAAKLAEEWKADLIIAGRGQLRSHAYAIIRDSPCPVVTV
jgi:nucleotide-binding universal stress UspA family protein